jgi:hypothetical protein
LPYLTRLTYWYAYAVVLPEKEAAVTLLFSVSFDMQVIVMDGSWRDRFRVKDC